MLICSPPPRRPPPPPAYMFIILSRMRIPILRTHKHVASHVRIHTRTHTHTPTSTTTTTIVFTTTFLSSPIPGSRISSILCALTTHNNIRRAHYCSSSSTTKCSGMYVQLPLSSCFCHHRTRMSRKYHHYARRVSHSRTRRMALLYASRSRFVPRLLGPVPALSYIDTNNAMLCCGYPYAERRNCIHSMNTFHKDCSGQY